jgi:hypothetical protein
MNSLTLKNLKAIPPIPPLPCGYVVRPDCYERLRADIPASSSNPFGAPPFTGPQIYPKPQTAEAYVFHDRATMLAYLRDDITEADLLKLADLRK